VHRTSTSAHPTHLSTCVLQQARTSLYVLRLILLRLLKPGRDESNRVIWLLLDDIEKHLPQNKSDLLLDAYMTGKNVDASVRIVFLVAASLHMQKIVLHNNTNINTECKNSSQGCTSAGCVKGQDTRKRRSLARGELQQLSRVVTVLSS
jgi:hypothetical protein